MTKGSVDCDQERKKTEAIPSDPVTPASESPPSGVQMSLEKVPSEHFDRVAERNQAPEDVLDMRIKNETVEESPGNVAELTKCCDESDASIAEEVEPAQDAALRRGKWTTEEEKYVERIIIDFNAGFLEAAEGTTLRSYLSDKLNCDPMRITKKFTGEACIGKRVFHPLDVTVSSINQAAVATAQASLAALEAAFRAKLEEQKREHTRKLKKGPGGVGGGGATLVSQRRNSEGSDGSEGGRRSASPPSASEVALWCERVHQALAAGDVTALESVEDIDELMRLGDELCSKEGIPYGSQDAEHELGGGRHGDSDDDGDYEGDEDDDGLGPLGEGRHPGRGIRLGSFSSVASDAQSTSASEEEGSAESPRGDDSGSGAARSTWGRSASGGGVAHSEGRGWPEKSSGLCKAGLGRGAAYEQGVPQGRKRLRVGAGMGGKHGPYPSWAVYPSKSRQEDLAAGGLLVDFMQSFRKPP